MAASRRIARIVGPSLVVLAVTEWANMDIFDAQTPPVVYLNGTLLFIAGVAMVQAHNRWRLGWPLAVTLTGWGVLMLGLVRMIAPAGPQAAAGPLTDAIFVVLLALGLLLAWLGYRREGAACAVAPDASPAARAAAGEARPRDLRRSDAPIAPPPRPAAHEARSCGRSPLRRRRAPA